MSVVRSSDPFKTTALIKKGWKQLGVLPFLEYKVRKKFPQTGAEAPNPALARWYAATHRTKSAGHGNSPNCRRFSTLKFAADRLRNTYFEGPLKTSG